MQGTITMLIIVVVILLGLTIWSDKIDRKEKEKEWEKINSLYLEKKEDSPYVALYYLEVDGRKFLARKKYWDVHPSGLMPDFEFYKVIWNPDQGNYYKQGIALYIEK